MSFCPRSADFLSESATESWDRLRITCSQPFNKRRQFGLSFLCLRTADEHSENDTSSQENKSTKDEVRSYRKLLRIWVLLLYDQS